MDYTISIDGTGFTNIPPGTNNGDRIRFQNLRRTSVTVTLHGLFTRTDIPIAGGATTDYQTIAATNAAHEIEVPATDGTITLKGTIKVGTGW